MSLSTGRKSLGFQIKTGLRVNLNTAVTTSSTTGKDK